MRVVDDVGAQQAHRLDRQNAARAQVAHSVRIRDPKIDLPAQGRVVETDWSRRRLGVALDELRELDNVVGVAGGVEKVDAIRGAIAGGLIDTLVTDEPTATALLDRWG